MHHTHDGHCDTHGEVDLMDDFNDSDSSLKQNLLSLHPDDWKIKRRNNRPVLFEDPSSAVYPMDQVWYEDIESRRFIIMLTLTSIFFVIELAIGLISKSLALLTDSLHMLSDVIAMIIGFYSIRVLFLLFSYVILLEREKSVYC